MLRPLTNYKGRITSIFAVIYLKDCKIISKKLLEEIKENTRFFIGSLIDNMARDDLEIVLAIDYTEKRQQSIGIQMFSEDQQTSATIQKKWLYDALSSIQTEIENSFPKMNIQCLGLDRLSKPTVADIRVFMPEDMEHEEANILAFCTGPTEYLPKWTQDLFWVLQDERGLNSSKLLIAEELSVDGDRKFQLPTLRALLDEKQYPILTTDLPLEGGNILVGEDFMIIGKKDICLYQRETDESYNSILNWYWAAFKFGGTTPNVFVPELYVEPDYQHTWKLEGKNIQSVSPNIEQLIYHLDLYLTLGGKLPNGKQLIFVAEYIPGICFIGDENGQKDIVQALEIVSQWLDGQAAWFKEQCSGFFHVERVPVAYFADFAALASFNNGLIEVISETEKKAYLPRYESLDYPEKVKLLEDIVETVFQKHEFNIRWIQGKFERMIQRAGSLHCRVKILQRE